MKTLPIADCQLPIERQLVSELRAWLDQQTITSENIGEIRRRLLVPWSSAWNGVVRDETAARENRHIPESKWLTVEPCNDEQCEAITKSSMNHPSGRCRFQAAPKSRFCWTHRAWHNAIQALPPEPAPKPDTAMPGVGSPVHADQFGNGGEPSAQSAIGNPQSAIP